MKLKFLHNKKKKTVEIHPFFQQWANMHAYREFLKKNPTFVIPKIPLLELSKRERVAAVRKIWVKKRLLRLYGLKRYFRRMYLRRQRKKENYVKKDYQNIYFKIKKKRRKDYMKFMKKLHLVKKYPSLKKKLFPKPLTNLGLYRLYTQEITNSFNQYKIYSKAKKRMSRVTRFNSFQTALDNILDNSNIINPNPSPNLYVVANTNPNPSINFNPFQKKKKFPTKSNLLLRLRAKKYILENEKLRRNRKRLAKSFYKQYRIIKKSINKQIRKIGTYREVFPMRFRRNQQKLKNSLKVIKKTIRKILKLYTEYFKLRRKNRRKIKKYRYRFYKTDLNKKTEKTHKKSKKKIINKLLDPTLMLQKFVEFDGKYSAAKSVKQADLLHKSTLLHKLWHDKYNKRIHLNKDFKNNRATLLSRRITLLNRKKKHLLIRAKQKQIGYRKVLNLRRMIKKQKVIFTSSLGRLGFLGPNKKGRFPAEKLGVRVGKLIKKMYVEKTAILHRHTLSQLKKLQKSRQLKKMGQSLSKKAKHKAFLRRLKKHPRIRKSFKYKVNRLRSKLTAKYMRRRIARRHIHVKSTFKKNLLRYFKFRFFYRHYRSKPRLIIILRTPFSKQIRAFFKGLGYSRPHVLLIIPLIRIPHFRRFSRKFRRV